MRDEFQPTLRQLLSFQSKNGLSILLTLDEIQKYASYPGFRRMYVPAEFQPYDEYRTLRMVFELDGCEERLQVEVMPATRYT